MTWSVDCECNTGIVVAGRVVGRTSNPACPLHGRCSVHEDCRNNEKLGRECIYDTAEKAAIAAAGTGHGK